MHDEYRGLDGCMLAYILLRFLWIRSRVRAVAHDSMTALLIVMLRATIAGSSTTPLNGLWLLSCPFSCPFVLMMSWLWRFDLLSRGVEVVVCHPYSSHNHTIGFSCLVTCPAVFPSICATA